MSFTFSLERHRVTPDRGDRRQNIHFCFKIFAKWIFLSFSVCRECIKNLFVFVVRECKCGVFGSLDLVFSDLEVSTCFFCTRDSIRKDLSFCVLLRISCLGVLVFVGLVGHVVMRVGFLDAAYNYCGRFRFRHLANRIEIF